MRHSLILFLAAASACASSRIPPVWKSIGTAELFMPNFVSTQRTEVRITFSPDGNRMLWGTIGLDGSKAGWEIMESARTGSTWSNPHPASFNSPANDFDPSFAPDGSGVYFFSNREGGFGKDDIYFAPFNTRTGAFGAAVNLGPEINTPQDEWAPGLSSDGSNLLFASDGHGGKGRHDLFTSQRQGSGWSTPVNLEEVNSAEEDFDATFLPGSRSIVLTSGTLEGAASLYYVPFLNGHYGVRQKLGSEVNLESADGWTFGPAFSPSEKGVLYFSSHRAGNSVGEHADIYRIHYTTAESAK